MAKNVERPGDPISERHEFEIYCNTDPNIQDGFVAPDGTNYKFDAGEQLVFNMDSDSGERKPFIKKDGKEIPFEEWKNGK